MSGLLHDLENGGIARLDRAALDRLIETGELLREDRSALAGSIRTLRHDGRILVQERNPEGELFLRAFSSEAAAARFVQSRLDAYERMWDG
jgi:hypothetical protein